MAKFKGGYGLQFTMHLASGYKASEFVQHAEQAHAAGFDQVWINDNLRYRQQFVVMAAIAARVPIKIGTAITVPYFRNPLDFADTLASLSELCDGRELSIGISRGDVALVGHMVEMQKPITTIRETVEMTTALLRGERIRFGNYPQLTSYFHLKPDRELDLAFKPIGPVCFFTGSNGPKVMEIAGRIMDGVLFSGLYITYLKLGRIPALLKPALDAGAAVNRKSEFRKVAEVNVAVSRDPQRAVNFAKKYAAHSMHFLENMGVTDDELKSLQIGRDEIDVLKRHWAANETVEQVAEHVTEPMVRSCFAAGTPEQVADELQPMIEAAYEQGIEQIVLSKLGPDYVEAIDLLSKVVLPRLGR